MADKMTEKFFFATAHGWRPYWIPSAWDVVNVWGTVYCRVRNRHGESLWEEVA